MTEGVETKTGEEIDKRYSKMADELEAKKDAGEINEREHYESGKKLFEAWASELSGVKIILTK